MPGLMNIGNIKLTKEKLIIAICGVIAFIVLLILYVPLIMELRSRYLESRSYERQIIDGRQTIDTASRIDRKEELFTEKNVSGPIDGLTKHCSSAGISVLSISPKEIIKQDGLQFKVLPIDMETRSTVQQFAAFIGSLTELKNGLVKVKGFDLTPDTEDKLKVRAKLSLDIYITNAE